MSDDASRSELIDKWDKIFRDICREIVCPPSVDGQPVDGRPLEIGWQRDAGDFDEKGLLQSVADGFEEFWNAAEDDAHARTMLEWEVDYGPDFEATEGDPDRSADLASESDAVGNSSFFDKSQGPTDSGFFGENGLENRPDWGRWRYHQLTFMGWLERRLCEPVEAVIWTSEEYDGDRRERLKRRIAAFRRFSFLASFLLLLVECTHWTLWGIGKGKLLLPSSDSAFIIHVLAAFMVLLWLLASSLRF